MKNCIETPCVLDRKCQLFLYKKTLCRTKKDKSGVRWLVYFYACNILLSLIWISLKMVNVIGFD